MVVGLITTCALSACRHKCCEFESRRIYREQMGDIEALASHFWPDTIKHTVPLEHFGLS